ncbi:MAG: putative toxin-antitoxin system toxin component, PIN family [Gammaproteobacteria bacterium]|nr:putative toxin-antitoxin system toxin component, PIN family [Gammaproteobacteria bacterium]
MRVVIDTNVWVSRLLLADSVAARAVDSALRNSEVIVSEPLIEELADVLAREKFDRYVSLADREEFLRRILQVAATFPVLSEVDDCRDADDNRLLALALDSQSDYILTGDKDLLTMSPWRGILIISPRAFLDATALRASPEP